MTSNKVQDVNSATQPKPQQQETLAGDHQRLRHDNLDGTQPTSTSGSVRTREGQARDQLSSLQEVGFQMTRGVSKRKRRNDRRRSPIWTEQIQEILQDEQIQELLETAIEDTTQTSTLELSPSQLQNINREIYRHLKNLLANGSLDGSADEFQKQLFTALTRFHLGERAAEQISQAAAERMLEIQENVERAEAALSFLITEPNQNSQRALTRVIEVLRELSPQERARVLARLKERDLDLQSYAYGLLERSEIFHSLDMSAKTQFNALLGAAESPELTNEQFEDRLLGVFEELLRRRYVALSGAECKRDYQPTLIEQRRARAQETMDFVSSFYEDSLSMRRYLQSYADDIYIRNALSWVSGALYEVNWQNRFAEGSYRSNVAYTRRELRHYRNRVFSNPLLAQHAEALREHEQLAVRDADASLQEVNDSLDEIIRHWKAYVQESGTAQQDILDDLSPEQFQAADRIYRHRSFSDGRSLYQTAVDEHSLFGTDDQIAYNAGRGDYSNERDHRPISFSTEQREAILASQNLDTRRAAALRDDALMGQVFQLLDAPSAESPLGMVMQLLDRTSDAYRERVFELLQEVSADGASIFELFEKREAAILQELSVHHPQLAEGVGDSSVDLLSDRFREILFRSAPPTTDGAQLILLASQIAELREARAYLETGEFSPEREQSLLSLRMTAFGALEGTHLASEEVEQHALETYSARRAQFFTEWYGVSGVRVERSIPIALIQDAYERESRKWQQLATVQIVRQQAYQLGIQSELHESDRIREERMSVLRARYDEYFARQSAYFDNEFRLLLQSEFDQAFLEGEKRGTKLHALVGTLYDSLTGWDLGIVSFEDNEAFYNALRQIHPSEMAAVEASFYDRHGLTLHSYIHDEFGGVEYDLARDLKHFDYGAASAAELMLELSRFWGPRTDELCRIVGEGRLRQERFEEVFSDRYAGVLENRINAARRAHGSGHGVGGYYGALPEVHIHSVEDALRVTLFGDKHRLVEAVYRGDTLTEAAVRVHQFFGVFNDQEKALGLFLEQYIQNEWQLNPETGKVELSEKGKEALRNLEQRFEELYDTSFRSYLLDRLGDTAEYMWCIAILDGDRIGADAGRLAFAWHGSGTDEKLTFETFQQTRSILLSELGLTEEILERSEKEKKRFEEAWERYIADLRRRYNREFDESLERRAKFEMEGDELVIFDVLLGGGEFEEIHRLRLAMGGALDGTDDAVVMEILRSAADEGRLEELSQEYKELFDLDLKKQVLSELSGDNDFDARDLFLGEPKTAEEMAERLLARIQYEHSGILDGEVFGEDLTRNGFGLDDILPGMDEAHRRFLDAYEQYQEIKEQNGDTSEIEAKLARLYRQTKNHADSYRAVKNVVANALTEVVTTTAVLAVSIGSMGSLSWIAVAKFGAVALISRVGMKALTKGEAYGVEEIGGDVALAALETGTAVLGTAAARGMGKLFRGNAAAQAFMARSGAKFESQLGSLMMKESVEEGADQVREIGVRRILAQLLDEGVELEVKQGVRVVARLGGELGEDAVTAALKGGMDDVYALLGKNLLLEAGEDAFQKTALQLLKRECQTEWIDLAIQYSRLSAPRRIAVGIANGAIDGFVASGTEGFVLAAVNPYVWENGFLDGFSRALENGLLYGAIGGGIGGALGGAFAIRDRTAKLSKEITEADYQRIKRLNTPEGRAEWRAAASEAMAAAGPYATRVPNSPPMQLAEEGLQLLETRLASHGRLTVGDVEDAILASRKLSGRKLRRAVANLEVHLNALEREASKIGAGGPSSARRARVNELRDQIAAFRARAAAGDAVNELEYLNLLGKDPNFYFYRRPLPDAPSGGDRFRSPQSDGGGGKPFGGPGDGMKVPDTFEELVSHWDPSGGKVPDTLEELTAYWERSGTEIIESVNTSSQRGAANARAAKGAQASHGLPGGDGGGVAVLESPPSSGGAVVETPSPSKVKGMVRDAVPFVASDGRVVIPEVAPATTPIRAPMEIPTRIPLPHESPIFRPGLLVHPNGGLQAGFASDSRAALQGQSAPEPLASALTQLAEDLSMRPKGQSVKKPRGFGDEPPLGYLAGKTKYQALTDEDGKEISFSPYDWNIDPIVTLYAKDLRFRKKIVKELADYFDSIEEVRWSEALY